MSLYAFTRLPRRAGIILAVVVLTIVGAAACGGDTEGEPVAPNAEPATQAVSEAEPTPESTAEPTPDPTFDISNREQAAARLSYLYQILADGNPISDPIGWAKAGAAATRVEEICNNFEIDEDLDPACDQLLLVVETPFNQLGPILAAAASELRTVLPRRDFVDYQDQVKAWDGDIGEWEFSREARLTLREIHREARQCINSESNCTAVRAASLLALSLVLLQSYESAGSIDQLIFVAAISDLLEDVRGLAQEDSSYGRQLDAQHILDELEDLGID